MLNRVLDLIGAAGWFDVDAPFEKTINLTQGACLWLLLTRNGVCDTYVKFSDCVDLEREAQRCEASSRCYPALVPRFVGYTRRDGFDILVCRAVDYRTLSAARLLHQGAAGPMLRDLTTYFATMAASRLPPALTPLRNADLAAGLQAYFDGHALGSLTQRWLASDAAGVATRLPDVPQHGDLVLNNIGQTAADTAIVFDWEDFGASCLPGLDLFTLELSLSGDAAQLFAGRGQPTHPLQQFVRNACRAMQLALDDYQALTPVYALVFRHLKRNYGPEVRERMDRLLLDIDRQRPPVSGP